MKVSFESPLCLLQDSFSYNDYDFLLYHLIDKYPEYRSFVKESKRRKRVSILDNSAYELDCNYDVKRFKELIEEYQPTFYILPDQFEDCKKTIENAKEFLSGMKGSNCLSVGVLQGSTVSDMIKCYNFMKNRVEMISISFKLPVFKDIAMNDKTWRTTTEDGVYALGRYLLVSILETEGVLHRGIPHHLLGCNLPQEVVYYREIPWIASIDTSNPIVAGIEGYSYFVLPDYQGTYGLYFKPKPKVQDLMNVELTEDMKTRIDNNILKFKWNLNKS